jgi:hypothetical protein
MFTTGKASVFFGLSTRLVMNAARRSMGPGQVAGAAIRGREKTKFGYFFEKLIQNASSEVLVGFDV